MTPVRRYLHWLGARAPGPFGRLLLAGILCANGFNLWLSTSPTSVNISVGDPLADPALFPMSAQDPVSVAWLLPSWLLFSSWLRPLCILAFVVFAVLWLGRVLLPWSSWMALFAAGLGLSHSIQASTHVDHIYQVPFQVLVVFAIWSHLDPSLRFTPRWVVEGSAVCIGLFYFWAGFNKLRYVGFEWLNGLNMQLWVYCFGYPDTELYFRLLEDRRLALAGQSFGLLVELAAPLLAVARFRTVVATGLLALHLGIYLVFGWNFLANVVTIALIGLPLHRFWRTTSG